MHRDSPLPSILLALLISILAGCAGIAQRAADRFANNLGRAVFDHDDPATVADGLPAYLLLLDGMIHGDAKNPALLRAAAGMYAAYAGSFVDDPRRAAILAARAHDYARRATCLDETDLCASLAESHEAFVAAVANVGDAAHLHSIAVAWATRIQTHSDDLASIADIPRVEVLLQRVVELEPSYDRGMPWVYLGVLRSLRPPAVGGKPEQGRAAFEQALDLSQQRNLMAKTLYARYYARLVFDQALHDRLLGEVIAAEPKQSGYTLSNVLAQQQARELLRTSSDYF